MNSTSTNKNSCRKATPSES